MKYPDLSTPYAVLGAPVRHVFMIGAIWYLSQRKEIKNLLEVGSWCGASALTWSQALTSYNAQEGLITCIDLWEPFFNILEHPGEAYIAINEALENGSAYELFKNNIKSIKFDIQYIRGKSENILPLLAEGVFDVVYVDGNHTYDTVRADLEIAKSLVSEGGIICGDDLNLQMDQCDIETALQNPNQDTVRDPKTGKNFHPGVTLAVNEIFGKVSSWAGFWAMQKKGKTWNPISLKGMPIILPDHFPQAKKDEAMNHLKDISII